MTRVGLVLLVCLGLGTVAGAQDATPAHVTTGEPVSLAVAMAGVVVASAGFGLMLRTTEPCNCAPRTAWVVGGVAVVAAGVTLTWLGLRSRTVTIAPSLGPHAVGAVVTRQWGAR